MTWKNDTASRQRDAERYRDPQYVRNSAIVRRRANGICEQCGRRGRIQVDHKIPLAVRIDHSLANLWALCEPCHRSKTARDSRHAPRRPADPGFDNDRPRTQF